MLNTGMYSSKRSLMGLSRILVVLALVAHALAVPAAKGNVTITTYGETTFASEPHGRGTVGILISCTATFIFCIWTAVHPNIVPGVTTKQRLYYKAILMFVSILVPEGILVCAMGEYRIARRLKEAWQKHNSKYKSLVDMQVAYFIVMGGFYIDEAYKEGDLAIHEANKEDPTIHEAADAKRASRKSRTKKDLPPPPRPYRAILTPTGFKNYMNQGLIHEKSFDKAAIRDKGKASTFGKFLAAIQAFWLVVECATRWHAGLTLSLLEIHVLIHVVRTASIYAFWWSKPLDVNEPIRIKLRKQEPDGAAQGLYEKSEQVEATGMLALTKTRPFLRWYFVGFLLTLFSFIELEKEINVAHPRHDSAIGAMSPVLHSESIITPLQGPGALQDAINDSAEYQSNEPDFITTQSPQTFLSFNNKALYDIIIQIDIGERENRPDANGTTGFYLHKTSNQRYARQEEEKDTAKSKDGLSNEGTTGGMARFSWGLFAEALLVCLTGALHAAAWNSRFPNYLEQWLWRISALAMCFCCLGIFLIANFTEYEQDLIAIIWKSHLTDLGLWESLRQVLKDVDRVCKTHAGYELERDAGGDTGKNDKKRLKYILHQFAVWLVLFFVLVYFFSASYITVESYLSLREAPRDMFLTASWTDYWPHL